MNIDVKNCEIIKLKHIVDKNDGDLSIAEQNKEIPFEIKRVYYIYELLNNKSSRGFHAHKKLDQVIFCLNGHFKLLVDDGTNKKRILLSNPNQGVFIGNELWHTMSNFSKNCIILVFASDYYDESDYIRDYNEFIRYIKGIK